VEARREASSAGAKKRIMPQSERGRTGK